MGTIIAVVILGMVAHALLTMIFAGLGSVFGTAIGGDEGTKPGAWIGTLVYLVGAAIVLLVVLL